MVEWIKNNIKAIVFYVVFFFTMFAFNLISDNYDYDFWARLVVGKHIVQTGQVLKQDFLSYIPTHIWIDHEWGSSLVYYLVQHFFSHMGLVLLQTIVLFLIYVLIVQIVKLRGIKTTHPYNFLYYLFSAWSLMIVYYQPFRCHLFSFVFFTLFLYILELARNGESRPLWTLPLIMLIWENIHGGCAAGFGLMLIYIIGELINKKSVKKYFLAFLLSCLVLPINPWGIDYIIYLLQANTMYRANILEWQGLFIPIYKYVFLEFKYFLATMILCEAGYITYAIKTKSFKFDATKYLILLTTLFLALSHIKLMPFCTIAFTVFLYDDFYTFFNSITLDAFNKIAVIKDSLVYIAIITIVSMNIAKADFKPFLDFKKFPVLPVEFIRINNIKGNLLTDLEFGSYASYKLYPNIKVFIDGRYEEVFYPETKLMLDNFVFKQNNWQELLKTYSPDLILLYKKHPVCEELYNSPNWKLVMFDPNYVLFIRKSMVKQNYKKPSEDINYYKQHFFDTNIDFKYDSKN